MRFAFILTLIAAVSDAVDGIIAKTFNKITVLGGYLDPIADKALLVGTFVALGSQGFLPSWLVILVVFRDFVIVGGALFFQILTHSLCVKPILLSKFNTVVQLILIVSILGANAFNLNISNFHALMIYLVALTTLFSGMSYIIIWIKKASDFEQKNF